MKNVQIFSTKSEFDNQTAAAIIAIILATLETRPECHLVLTGGNTPRGVYSQLAGFSRNLIEWQRVHLYWGDERMVPPEHVDSNYRMAKETLLEHIDIPRENIHRIRGEINPAAAAVEYAALLKEKFHHEPRFDLMLLGVGKDGHTASLFPGTKAVVEKKKLVAEVFVRKLDSWRVTLTLPVINNARQIMFLVAGKSKAEILKKIIRAEPPTTDLPASLVRPTGGELYWMLDADAAAKLGK